MKIKDISKRNNSLYIFIASIWLFFSCILIVKAFNESLFYDSISGSKNITNNTRLEQKINAIQNTLQANEVIKKQEYEKALQLISWNKGDDYYNRWTIQTLLAYKNGLQSNISWLESAQRFIAQAQQNFAIAKKLSPSKTVANAIMENQNTIDTLSTVVDIKTCYSIGQTIITNMNDIITTIKNIKDTLNQEDTYIKKRSKILPDACYQKLVYILDTSRGQVWLLQWEMQKNTTNYINDFSEKIENPIICIQTPYENILSSITKGKEGLEEYKKLHTNTIEALKSNDTESIKQLCDQSKNDAQINQKIESSIQELLQKLEDNKTENKQQRATNQVNYKDFFNENEKKVLEDIKSTNQWRIDTILNIRGKGNYNAQKYINDMFNQFYGNSGDFINLHK